MICFCHQHFRIGLDSGYKRVLWKCPLENGFAILVEPGEFELVTLRMNRSLLIGVWHPVPVS